MVDTASQTVVKAHVNSEIGWRLHQERSSFKQNRRGADDVADGQARQYIEGPEQQHEGLRELDRQCQLGRRAIGEEKNGPNCALSTAFVLTDVIH